jgi:hypothetical protein
MDGHGVGPTYMDETRAPFIHPWMNGLLRKQCREKGTEQGQQVRLQKKLRKNHDSSSGVGGIASKLHKNELIRTRTEEAEGDSRRIRRRNCCQQTLQPTAGEAGKDWCKC